MPCRLLGLSRVALVVLALCGATCPARAAVNLLFGVSGGTGLDYQGRFDCQSDAGGHLLVPTLSVEEPAVIHEVEAVIDYCSGSLPLPAWWQFDAGHRDGALTVTAGGTPDASWGLVDPWGGPVPATVSWEKTAINMARIVVHVVLPTGSEVSLNEGVTYLPFVLGLSHAGTTTNEGCDVGVCLVLNDLRILGPDGLDIRQHQYRPEDPFRYTYWQDGVSGCPFIVPAAATTWSGIKARYR